MKIFKTSPKQRTEANRKRRLGTRRQTGYKVAIDRDGLVRFLLYLSFGLLTLFICFFGLSSAGPMLQVDQDSRIRIIAEIPFTYVSKIESESRMEAVRQRVPPVFRLDLRNYRAYRSYMDSLMTDLEAFAKVPENTPENLARLQGEEVTAFLKEYPAGNPYSLRPNDLATLHNQLGSTRSLETVIEGLIILGDIFNKGVYHENSALSHGPGENLTMFHVEDELGNLKEVEILSEEEGLRTLRIQLAALDIPRESSVALFRILRSAYEPNLVFDEENTRKQVLAAQETVEEVVFSIAEGQTIIEPNTKVTPRQYEQLEAYRRILRNSESGNFGLNSLFFERALLTLLVVMGAAFFLKISNQSIRHNHRIFSLCGGIILFNAALMRLVIELGDSAVAESYPEFIQLLPYLTPIILGPMAITILVRTGPGILASGIISTLNAMMLGNSLSVLLLSQMVCLVAIAYCRNIQFRASLVRAGLIAGGFMAAGSILIAVRDNLAFTQTVYQVLASCGNGLISGVLIVGLIPILEQLFKYTTDITLLELTDFNHPLLRKMQIEAPGSYHHSLMVANLSENAAAAIGANSLICRVCSLFHDIGKMVKPNYFIENQHTGQNPHLERNPSMSALVIKSHVKEGVQMAREYRLPKIITKVIQQHHGTTLIHYFYYKALERQRAEGSLESTYPNAPKIELNQVNEDTYRYEGPIPQFTESALIMLADSVEAASRSLKKVNPQSVEELVNNIILTRMKDGQLDATPMTFKQLIKVKETFVFTLLNVLHARVEYPEGTPEKGGGGNRARKRAAAARLQTPPAVPVERK